MKKILRLTVKCMIALLILLLTFVAYIVSNWQFRYVYTQNDKYFNTFITIMGEEYYFDASPVLHSEKEFRKVSTGITYEELVAKFGNENGQLNSNGLKNAIYYALAEDRFVVFNLTDIFSSETGEITITPTVWRIALCDDKEELEILSVDKEIYFEGNRTGEIYYYGDKDKKD